MTGQLGTGDADPSLDPAASVPGTVVEQVSAGGFHTCAITTAGAASCWGADDEGQLGIGGGVGSQLTAQTRPGSWSSISAGFEHGCGIQPDETLWCWGKNHRGQLGIGSRIDAHVPTRVGTESGWSAVFAGFSHTCATKSDGSLWCWGDNTDAQLANGTAWRATFVQAP